MARLTNDLVAGNRKPRASAEKDLCCSAVEQLTWLINYCGRSIFVGSSCAVTDGPIMGIAAARGRLSRDIPRMDASFCLTFRHCVDFFELLVEHHHKYHKLYSKKFRSHRQKRRQWRKILFYNWKNWVWEPKRTSISSLNCNNSANSPKSQLIADRFDYSRWELVPVADLLHLE